MYEPDCRRCPLHETTSNVCIAGTGNPNADIILYGEAPGATEEEGGEPFIGPAGKVLDQALAQAGLSRNDIFISNVVRCRPPDNRTPYVGEQKACRTFTASELATVTPKVIVTLGGSPLKALTGLNAVGKARGRSQRLHKDYRSEIPVVPTWHPAATLHQPHLREQIISDLVSDLKAAKHQVAGDEDMDFVTLKPTNKNSFKRFLKCSSMTVDLEWEVLPDGTRNGAGWPWSKREGKLPRLVSIGMAAREADGTVITLSAPWEGAKENIQKALKLVIERVPSIYHFGTSDVVWLMYYGIKPRVQGDTHLLATLLNIETAASLEVLAATLMPDLPTWKAEGDATKGKWPSTPQEWASLLAYNSKDCVVTLLLHEHLMTRVHELDRAAFLPLYQRVLSPAIKVLSGAAINGARLNRTLLEQGKARLEQEISDLRIEIAEMVGMPGRIDITRGDALAPLVEKLLGIEFPKTAKTNKPSMTIDNLLIYKGQHSIVDKLLALSAAKKQYSTYYDPWLWLLDSQGDDRLHTVYKLTEARTGRTSAMGDGRGATMQQYPHGDMRQMVIAKPGYKLVLGDESQVELRIGAWVAQEPTMKRFLLEGKDLHTTTAGWFKAVSEGVSISDYMSDPKPWMDTVTYEERTAAKIPNFAYLYGGREGVAIATALKDYGIVLDFATAKRMRDGYFTLYPRLLEWHATDGPRDVARGYCESPLGRRRYASSIPDKDPEGLIRKYVNTPVQATASDLTLAAMVLIDDEIERRGLAEVALLIGFVHDSVMYEVREDLVMEIADIVRTAMENPMLDELQLALPVPLVADIEVGDNWADAKKIERVAA